MLRKITLTMNIKDIFYPQIFTSLKNYKRQDLQKDLLSGLIVGIVALPMAIAFGIASGVTPEQGLITAIVAGFLISLLGGSTVQIGGPTGAFIVIVAGVVAKYGIAGLTIATLMAGVMLVVMGLLKLGDIIKFIPYPVVVGFTGGIAVVIFSTQMNDFFGLGIEKVPSAFHEKWMTYFQNIDHINWYATAIAAGTVLIHFIWRRINQTIPAALVAIIITTLVVQFYGEAWGVETIGSRFGEMKTSLPLPSWPDLSFDDIRDLLPVAFTIAMLGAIESLLSAMVADGATGHQHHSNTELVAQGAANLITPLFGGIPATGAIARTMTNIRNGGRTPVAGIVHAVVLLLILLFFGKWAKMIPMACLAGVLVVIAYNMSEWRSFRGLFRNARHEVAVLLTTFFLTVIFDLTIAIEIGLVLALFLFVRRISKTSQVQIFHNEVASSAGELHDNRTIPEGVDIFRINGPFFFGVANKFDEANKRIRRIPKVRIVDVQPVPFMDASGLRNFENFCRKCQGEKIHIVVAGANANVKAAIHSSTIYQKIGAGNFYDTIEEAVKAAGEMVSPN